MQNCLTRHAPRSCPLGVPLNPPGNGYQHTAMGQNPVPPVNIPIPTETGSKMGGEFTCPKIVPLVLTHGRLTMGTNTHAHTHTPISNGGWLAAPAAWPRPWRCPSPSSTPSSPGPRLTERESGGGKPSGVGTDELVPKRKPTPNLRRPYSIFANKPTCK